MSVDDNKALYRRMIDQVWNQGNVGVADEAYGPGAGSPSMPYMAAGPEGIKQIAIMFRTGFPDLQITVEDLVGEGDRLAARLTERGTHTGEWMGIPPTGKPVEFTQITIMTFTDGKIDQSWFELNMAGIMQQLGVGPGAGA